MEAGEALRRIAFLLERANEPVHRVRAFRRAAAAVDDVGADEIARRAAAGELKAVPGIGDTTARVIIEALAGETPAYLRRLEASGSRPPTYRAAGGDSGDGDGGGEDADRDPLGESGVPGSGELRAALRGDCHTHSNWSDGGSPIREMALAARDLGHEYLALTDHSPRLTVANGLSADRLRAQLDQVAALNAELAGSIRVLTGIEVDILEDGSLDQDPELLGRLDLVVASVHSKLRMPREEMTRRMVTAIANPHTDVLGHCTGRLLGGGRGTRPESTFDAELVFAACERFGVAVEINSRPERKDPPLRLLRLAAAAGCHFAIDTDAHAPGQLDWQPIGCRRAAECGVDPGSVVNTWTADELLAWAST